MPRILRTAFSYLSWYLWRRRVIRDWIASMEAARKLFPSMADWSPMRATGDVLASVDQKLMAYIAPDGRIDYPSETKALRKYESTLLDLLERQVAEGSYTKIDANAVIEMLSYYTRVHSARHAKILALLATHEESQPATQNAFTGSDRDNSPLEDR